MVATSLAEQVADLNEQAQRAWIETLPRTVIRELAADPWWWTGRESQQTPLGDWLIWLILAGRGWGKTRTGAEWLADEIEAFPVERYVPTEWAIVAETFSDCRKVCVEGPSGFLNVLRRRNTPYHYLKGAWQIHVGSEGSVVHMLAADDPDAGRGFNLAGLWGDELGKWRNPHAIWDEGLAPALRIGENPRACITTTPKPIKLLRQWRDRADGSVHITRGSTFENARHLSKKALAELLRRYEGTRIGRQELYAEIIDDVEGALWTWTMLNRLRIDTEATPDLLRVVVGVDPALTAGEDSDETGIVVAAQVKGSTPPEYLILDDFSGRYSPETWARKASEAAEQYGAERIVAEANNGGDLVKHVLEQAAPWQKQRVKLVHASQGKKTRAEPIVALYEQERVHHVAGLGLLEEQMTGWVPGVGTSPDRVDAAVWAITALAGRPEPLPPKSFAT
jgi:phage terminase large subunit-like protein